MAKEDKLKALDAAIAQIEKQYGKGSVMKLGDNTANMNVEAIPTGSLSLDIALGLGGLPKGRVIEIYGPESSGKTTVALHCVAEAQKRGGIAGFIDAEHALDPVYAKAIGVDIDNLYIDSNTKLLYRQRGEDGNFGTPIQLNSDNQILTTELLNSTFAKNMGTVETPNYKVKIDGITKVYTQTYTVEEWLAAYPNTEFKS